MVKKLGLVLLLLVFVEGFFGQRRVDVDVVESRYVYLLTSQVDSLNNQNKSEEYFVLERGKDKSQFMSLNSYKRDSIMMGMLNNAEAGQLKIDLSNVPKTAFSYRIIKDKAKNQVNFYDKIVRNNFVYEENLNFKWKIIEEKKNIGSLKCQAALISYGGRDYKAWFTNDIPVSEGPYKFYGLPGLIVEIEDSKKHYKFELLSYKNLANNNPLWIDEKRANAKKISKSDFYKALKSTQENFISEISKSGFTLDTNVEGKVKDNMKRRNNPIELIP